jgi:hypothetical protein
MRETHYRYIGILLLACWFVVCGAFADSIPEGGDTVVFKNGDRVSGQLLRADSEIVQLKSQALGELSIHWSDIFEVHSKNRSYKIDKQGSKAQSYTSFRSAVLRSTGSAIVVEADSLKVLVPRGWVEIVDQDHPAAGLTQLMMVTPPPPAPDTSMAVALNAPESVVLGSQSQMVFGGSLRILHNEPDLCALPSWFSSLLAAANHNKSYKVGAPAIVTDTFDGTLSLTNRLGSESKVAGVLVADLSGNSSLGIGLQQSYGVGVTETLYSSNCKGTTVIPRKQYLLKVNGDVSLRYIHERLYAPGSSEDLAGLRLSETLVYAPYFKTKDGVQTARFTITQSAWATPMLNDARAIQAGGLVKFDVPLGKSLSIGLMGEDDFINNAPKAKRKNYIKSALTVTYTFPQPPAK